MFVSTREIFSADHPAWVSSVKHQGSGDYLGVRTIDALLNPLAKDARDIETSPEILTACLEALPAPQVMEYHLLAINLDEDAHVVPAGWRLLGHDLTYETRTSSLLNCGPWKGRLEPFTKQQNDFGLLSQSDAESAQKLLPTEWGASEPHAHVMVWALYERE